MFMKLPELKIVSTPIKPEIKKVRLNSFIRLPNDTVVSMDVFLEALADFRKRIS
jgi:hypothetical protein